MSASRREELSKVVEIDLSHDEDSVTSLAVAQSSSQSLTAYAGINSSEAEQKAGKNEHLRSFRIDHPVKLNESAEEKSSENAGKTTALSQTSFFKPSTAAKKETYQRILRLSPIGEQNTHRVAAIATSLAPEEEIVLFKVTVAPQRSDELGRISLGQHEAADMDISEADEESNDFQLAYCSDSEVYIAQIASTSSKPINEPSLIYSVPPPSSSSKSPGRSKLRSLRFISSDHILLLQNKPQRSGAELLILRISNSTSQGSITLQRRLHKTTKSAVALDICGLSSSLSSNGNRQFVIAIASQSGSIELLSITSSPSSRSLSKFHPYAFLNPSTVGHPASITSLRFSHFSPPSLPVTSSTKPQYVKLASTSIASTVVVHTLPLSPDPPPPEQHPRYILAPHYTTSATQTAISVFNALLVIAISAFLLQAFTEIRGGVPPYLGAADWLSPRVRELIARPYMFSPEGGISRTRPAVESVGATLHDLVKQHAPALASKPQSEQGNGQAQAQSQAEKAKSIIVRHDPASNQISTEVRPVSPPSTENIGPDEAVIKDEMLRKWEDLHEHERAGWRRKLREAGQWAEGQGEAVLKGVFFSELAGVVGEFVAGAGA